MQNSKESFECHGCDEKTKRRRGCKRPGEHYDSDDYVFITQSPHVKDDQRRVYECPLGVVLRESPHIFDVIDVCGLAENCTPSDWFRMSRYMQSMIHLYGSERGRLREVKRENERLARDGRFGVDALRNAR